MKATMVSSSSFPFKRKVGMGMGFYKHSAASETHPHPSPPLEGEGIMARSVAQLPDFCVNARQTSPIYMWLTGDILPTTSMHPEKIDLCHR
jgi:hypothetical protein